MSGGGLTFYLVCAMVIMFFMDWLSVGFGCAGLFFLGSLLISMVSNVIFIFTLGAPFLPPPDIIIITY